MKEEEEEEEDMHLTNNKEDTPLSPEERRALHDQATKLLSAINSSPHYSVLGGWLVVFYFGLNAN